jgi:hypothetical protein
LFGAILVAVPVRARAGDPSSEGEAGIQRGVELRREGRNGEALVEFQKAFALEPSARARAQIGLALQALGDWLGAEHWLSEALLASEDAWIARYRTELQGALATVQAHLGSLVLHVDTQQGEVLVNGVVAQALPSTGPIRVVAGSIDVIVRVPGRADVHRIVAVPAGAQVSEVMMLGSEPIAPAAPPPSVTPAASDVGPQPAAPHSPPVAAYIALGSAGALAIASAVAAVVHENAADVWNDDAQCLRPGGGSRTQQCGTYHDTANVALGVEIGAFAAAAVSAGVGVWLLWPRSRSPLSSAGWCTPGLGGVTCGGMF